MAEAFKLYGDQDPREVPAYGMTEAARYLDIPVSTLRGWTVGQPYRWRGKERFFEPVIKIADAGGPLLSFWNLFEAYVCDALRIEDNISLQKIRAAIQFIRTTDPDSRHPLVEARFATSGVDLFIERAGELFGVSSAGTQMAMRECLERYLKRVDRDRFGRVARLYPFTRSLRTDDTPRVVVIDPIVMYGRPVIAGTDYQIQTVKIEEALRCEHPQAA